MFEPREMSVVKERVTVKTKDSDLKRKRKRKIENKS
jgi:hypothetical protein